MKLLPTPVTDQETAMKPDRLVYLLFNKWGILGRQDRDLFSLIIKPGMNIVDVGANIGLLSMAFARLAGSDGHVFAFEPESELFATLELNCRNNGFDSEFVACDSRSYPVLCLFNCGWRYAVK